MVDSFHHACGEIVEAVGLCRAGDLDEVRRLSGGVSSDIAMVRIGDRRYCVKRALGRLKVAAEWTAPLRRNATEYRWLTAAASFVPRSVPRLLGAAARLNGFVMDYVDPAGAYNWKAALLAGEVDKGEAEAVGRALATVHAGSARPEFQRDGFLNADDFRALRLDPYLGATALAHPDLAEPIMSLYEDVDAARIALLHGDVSPKNILMRGADPILLDAECATFGDPAFDVAFCMNHLFLKAIHMPERAGQMCAAAGLLWAAYREGVDWESRDALDRRAARLLPVLHLARVDGKSPVEYLGPAAREHVRMIARPLIASPPASVADFAAAILAGATL